MRIKLKLSRKISFALIAGVSLIGLGGVTAAQLITVNNNISLNMGAGETNTAACDRDKRINGNKPAPFFYFFPFFFLLWGVRSWACRCVAERGHT